MPDPSDGDISWRDRLAERAILKAIERTEGWPLPARRRALGATLRWLAGPLYGWPRLVRGNLALVRPDLPHSARRRLAAAASWNAGVSMAELLDPTAFRAELKNTPVAGPGVVPLKAARADGRGVVLVTAEIGNPDALCAVLAERGLRAAALGTADAGDGLSGMLEQARARLGGPRYPDTEKGRAAIEAYLARGGTVVLQGDQLTDTGAPVLLFGARVRTPVFAASIALRQHAEFMSAFALRRPDGGFGVWLTSPVEHGHLDEMMQAHQQAVETAAREFMDQFFWADARWRPERYRDRAAPSTGP